jgi:hypothetical protein
MSEDATASIIKDYNIVNNHNDVLPLTLSSVLLNAGQVLLLLIVLYYNTPHQNQSSIPQNTQQESTEEYHGKSHDKHYLAVLIILTKLIIVDFLQYLCGAKIKYYDYGKMKEAEGEDEWLERLNLLEGEFDERVCLEEQEARVGRARIENELKPSLGSPNNKHLLDNLIDRAQNYSKRVASNYMKIIKQYKVEFKISTN